MNDDDAFYYLRCWSFIKGALPMFLNEMREHQWEADDSALEIEKIINAAEAFGRNPHKEKS